MLNELKRLTKRSFKKNKKAIIISFLLLVTLTVFIHKLPYALFKPLYNRLVNISLIIGIVLNFYYKNVVLASILVLALIIINYYGSNKYYVHSYNNNHLDNYRVQDNSIFSKIKSMLNNSEHFSEENKLNIPMMDDEKKDKNGEEIAKEALDLIDNLVKEGQLKSLGDTKEHFDSATATQIKNNGPMTYPASNGTPVSTKVKNLIKNADKKLAEYKIAQNKLLAAEEKEMATIITTTNPKLKSLAKANVQATSQATEQSTAKAAEYLKDVIEHQSNKQQRSFTRVTQGNVATPVRTRAVVDEDEDDVVVPTKAMPEIPVDDVVPTRAMPEMPVDEDDDDVPTRAMPIDEDTNEEEEVSEEPDEEGEDTPIEERFTNMTTSAAKKMTTPTLTKKKSVKQGGRKFKIIDAGNTEKYTNFMSYELFSAQNNKVPQTTNIDNNVSPILGINEYCTQGNTLQSDVPVGFDYKCQMNCSNL